MKIKWEMHQKVATIDEPDKLVGEIVAIQSVEFTQNLNRTSSGIETPNYKLGEHPYDKLYGTRWRELNMLVVQLVEPKRYITFEDWLEGLVKYHGEADTIFKYTNEQLEGMYLTTVKKAINISHSELHFVPYEETQNAFNDTSD